MSKLISFAGVSRVDGVLKFRGAQNVNRINQLRKLGDTDVEMLFLGRDMTKSEAAKELLARDFADGREDVLALLVSVANDDNPFRAPKARTIKVKAKDLKISKTAAEVKVGRGALGKVYPEIKMTPKQAEQIRNEFNAKHKDLA